MPNRLAYNKVKFDKSVARLHENGWRLLRCIHHTSGRYYRKKLWLCHVDGLGNYKFSRLKEIKE